MTAHDGGRRVAPDGSFANRCVYGLGGLDPPESSRWWVYGDCRFRSSRSLLPTSLRLLFTWATAQLAVLFRLLTARWDAA